MWYNCKSKFSTLDLRVLIIKIEVNEMPNKDLTLRRDRILGMIIDSYVSTAEPIASRTTPGPPVTHNKAIPGCRITACAVSMLGSGTDVMRS